MKRNFIFLTSVLLFFILSLVSCEAVNVKKAIIGKWVEVREDGRYGEPVEFLKDGTVIVDSNAGNYKFIDDNRLKIDITRAMVFEVSIDRQGQLNLTDPAGKVLRYITEGEWKKRVAAARAEEEKKIKERLTFSDLTVLDGETKLMWTKDANIAGKRMDGDGAFKFIVSLNEQRYAGYSNWRLPREEEFLTLVKFSQGLGYSGDPSKIGFKNVQPNCYWSSNTYSPYADCSGGFFLWVGAVGVNNWSGDAYVWPVRAGQ